MGKFFFKVGDFLYFDIHSHILPAVDDGAVDIEESLELLKMARKSGISAMMVTPHFYPNRVNFEEFIESTENAYNELKAKLNTKKHPEIYLGCEILYYKGMSNWEELDSLTLGKSKYLLIEICDFDIKESLFSDLLRIKSRGYEPIIAHIERYYRFRGYKSLMKFVLENDIKVQINTSSILKRNYKRTIKQLINSPLFCVLGTDTHNTEIRPPLMKEALVCIRESYGREKRAKLIKNTLSIYSEIVGDIK